MQSPPRPETMTASARKVRGEKEREIKREMLHVSVVPLANLRKIPEEIFNGRLGVPS